MFKFPSVFPYVTVSLRGQKTFTYLSVTDSLSSAKTLLLQLVFQYVIEVYP